MELQRRVQDGNSYRQRSGSLESAAGSKSQRVTCNNLEVIQVIHPQRPQFRRNLLVRSRGQNCLEKNYGSSIASERVRGVTTEQLMTTRTVTA